MAIFVPKFVGIEPESLELPKHITRLRSLETLQCDFHQRSHENGHL